MNRAIIFLTIILLANSIGMYYGFYEYWWFDISLHFLGGFFMAMLMVHYLGDRTSQVHRTCDVANAHATKFYGSSILKDCLIIVGAVSFIGIVWEFVEYLASLTLIEPLYNNFGIKAYFIGDLDDTINDLLMDILGALAWLAVFRKK
jgi:hypothetical protein